MVLCVFVTRAQLYTTHVHYKSPLSEIASHGNEEKMNYEWAVKAIRVGGVESIYMCSEKTLAHMPATCKICAACCFIVRINTVLKMPYCIIFQNTGNSKFRLKGS